MYVQLTAPDIGRGWGDGSTPTQSLGGYISSTAVGGDLLATAYNVPDFRCIAIDTDGPNGISYNITLTLSGAGLVWALDPTAPSSWNSAEPQALSVPSPTSTPGALPWSTAPIVIADLDSDVQAIWVQRTPTGTPGPQTGQITAAWTDSDGAQTLTVPLTWVEPAPPPPPLPPATGPAVRDLWIGPLGALVPITQGATWERPRALGVSEFESLSGAVTTTRARLAPRRTTWAWQRLDDDTADVLAEIAYTARGADTTVCAIEPAARNLMGAEQSRGRPMPGGTTVDATDTLYTVVGVGEVAVGMSGTARHACVRDGAGGDTLIWLHTYYRDLGWPVMPGMPVHLLLTSNPNLSSIRSVTALRLEFRDAVGVLVGYTEGTPGSGVVSADAPNGAVTVSPRARITTAWTGLRLIGSAGLTYGPPPAAPALGTGAPVYAVTDYTDTPLPPRPYRDVAISLVEVRSDATR